MFLITPPPPSPPSFLVLYHWRKLSQFGHQCATFWLSNQSLDDAVVIQTGLERTINSSDTSKQAHCVDWYNVEIVYIIIFSSFIYSDISERLTFLQLHEKRVIIWYKNMYNTYIFILFFPILFNSILFYIPFIKFAIYDA